VLQPMAGGSHRREVSLLWQGEQVGGPVDFSTAWAGLAEPWRLCFELGWQAHRAGSLGVGAVVLDPSGTVVATGRNRSAERAAPAGQLAGTYLAHAEVNALVGLDAGGYEDHVLYTSLEPCLLCTAALIHCHVGEVRYAATDHLWHGVQRLPELNEHVARRWPTRVGPLTGPFAAWGAVMPLLWTLDRSPTGVVIAAHQRYAPGVVALARHLHATRPSWLEEDSVVDALDGFGAALAGADGYQL